MVYECVNRISMVHRSRVGEAYNSIHVDGTIVQVGHRAVPYIEAVFRAYQQRRALEGIGENR
jgi:hypothetical protein